MSVNDNIVPNFHVVAVRELDVLKCFEILSAALEYLLRENSPQLHSDIDVLPTHRRTVKRIPEPQQRLYWLKLLVLTLAVVFRLERDVARVERCEREPRSCRHTLILYRRFPVA